VIASARNSHADKGLKSPEQGAATTVYAAVAKEWEGRGGRYWANCAEARRDPEGRINVEGLSDGYVAHTYDEGEEGRLWKDFLRMVGIKDDL
jgi:hypothetical protein